MDTEIVKTPAKRAGFTESGLIPVSELTFDPAVRAYCRQNRCGFYNKSWACPPAVGSLESCREQVQSFEQMLLLSAVFPLKSAFDLAGMLAGMHEFKERIDLLDELLRDLPLRCLILSNEGCDRCRACTFPDAPCRYPKRLHPSIEGYGFMIPDLAKKAGLRFHHGAGTVTYFGAVLFAPKEE